ncbi:hypothetical protein CDL15_Pgr019708 [Punica granatum]|uniref:CDP-diacylglycerol--inositol 3-phosphatidyltransferase n=1 Tax=Punica granatum TaxID=22663 RepID=A0A218X6M4_PUNGR|nr:hypothetical protein CDL15_Pgr019708 [Punica granatum]
MGITHRREGQEKKAPEKAERTRRRRSGVAEGFAGRSSPLALSSTGSLPLFPSPCLCCSMKFSELQSSQLIFFASHRRRFRISHGSDSLSPCVLLRLPELLQWRKSYFASLTVLRGPYMAFEAAICCYAGYLRVLMNCVAFGVCFSNKRLFSVLYFLRISTACLLVILSNVYRPGMIFLLLLALDIASHWFQMYSTFLSGKVSHKDVKDSTSWLFKLYYGYRPFMAYCCVACEVLYIALFLLAEKNSENLTDVLVSSVKRCSALSFLLVVSLFGWTIKQAVNVIQMKTAADVCVLYDIAKKA